MALNSMPELSIPEKLKINQETDELARLIRQRGIIHQGLLPDRIAYHVRGIAACAPTEASMAAILELATDAYLQQIGPYNAGKLFAAQLKFQERTKNKAIAPKIAQWINNGDFELLGHPILQMRAEAKARAQIQYLNPPASNDEVGLMEKNIANIWRTTGLLP